MKILINRKPRQGPWGGGNLFVKAFCDESISRGHNIVHKLEKDIDLIFIQDPRYDELNISAQEIMMYKQMRPRTRVIHRVNECDARKNTDNMDTLLRSCSALSDASVFITNWIKEYHMKKGWLCTNTHVIRSGVDTEIFKPAKKLNNGKINRYQVINEKKSEFKKS